MGIRLKPGSGSSYDTEKEVGRKLWLPTNNEAPFTITSTANHSPVRRHGVCLFIDCIAIADNIDLPINFQSEEFTT